MRRLLELPHRMPQGVAVACDVGHGFAEAEEHLVVLDRAAPRPPHWRRLIHVARPPAAVRARPVHGLPQDARLVEGRARRRDGEGGRACGGHCVPGHGLGSAADDVLPALRVLEDARIPEGVRRVMLRHKDIAQRRLQRLPIHLHDPRRKHCLLGCQEHVPLHVLGRLHCFGVQAAVDGEDTLIRVAARRLVALHTAATSLDGQRQGLRLAAQLRDHASGAGHAVHANDEVPGFQRWDDLRAMSGEGILLRLLLVPMLNGGAGLDVHDDER
mmetsp:Transcript_133677/g.387002  ORF Transcript_133677/g.387002 Transcript_133677/m.387002 type:complete len:271 (+) Transcript_133677:2611-3423(+)